MELTAGNNLHLEYSAAGTLRYVSDNNDSYTLRPEGSFPVQTYRPYTYEDDAGGSYTYDPGSNSRVSGEDL